MANKQIKNNDTALDTKLEAMEAIVETLTFMGEKNLSTHLSKARDARKDFRYANAAKEINEIFEVYATIPGNAEKEKAFLDAVKTLSADADEHKKEEKSLGIKIGALEKELKKKNIENRDSKTEELAEANKDLADIRKSIAKDIAFKKLTNTKSIGVSCGDCRLVAHALIKEAANMPRQAAKGAGAGSDAGTFFDEVSDNEGRRVFNEKGDAIAEYTPGKFSHILKEVRDDAAANKNFELAFKGGIRKSQNASATPYVGIELGTEFR